MRVAVFTGMLLRSQDPGKQAQQALSPTSLESVLELHIGRTHPEVRGERKSINASHTGQPPGHCLSPHPHPRVEGWTEAEGHR